MREVAKEIVLELLDEKPAELLDETSVNSNTIYFLNLV